MEYPFCVFDNVLPEKAGQIDFHYTESYNQHLSKNLQIPVKQEPPRFHLPPSTDKASIDFLRI